MIDVCSKLLAIGLQRALIAISGFVLAYHRNCAAGLLQGAFGEGFMRVLWGLAFLVVSTAYSPANEALSAALDRRAIPGGFKVRDATRRVSLLVAFGFLSCLEITLAVCGAFAAQEAKKPTLYVDKIETNEDEVFVIYSYQTGFPPDTAEILQVALAQRRRLGFHNAVRSEDPTIRQCLATSIYGGACTRERATDNFCCMEPNNQDWHPEKKPAWS